MLPRAIWKHLFFALISLHRKMAAGVGIINFSMFHKNDLSLGACLPATI